MAQLINPELGKIIDITNEASHQAEYKPVIDAYGVPVAKPSHCDMPALLDISLNLTLPTIEDVKSCDLDFIPFPIIPPLFIPDDLTSPCPQGLSVSAGYAPGDLQKVGVTAATPAVVTGTSINFNDVISSEPQYPLPEVIVDFPQTINSGAETFVIEHGEQYKVIAIGSNLTSDDKITYENQDYFVDDTFFGKVLTVASAGKVQNSTVKVGLVKVQTRRVIGISSSLLNVSMPFTVPHNAESLNWKLNRFVVQVDDTRPVNANIQFRKVDQLGCEYQLLGELNLNTPCPEGFTFDAQYNSTVGEYLKVDAQGTILRDSSNTVTDFSTLIPHEVGQPLPVLELHTATATSLEAGKLYKVFNAPVTFGGTTYQPGQYITPSATATISGNGVVKKTYQNYVSAVNSSSELTILQNPGGEYPPTGLDGATTSNSWLLNRLVVKNDVGPSTFLYVKSPEDSCSGKLLGEINLPTAEAPCKNGTTVNIGTGTTLYYAYSDQNNYNNHEDTLIDTFALDGEPMSYAYWGGAMRAASLENGTPPNQTKTSLAFTASNTAAPTCCSTIGLPNLYMRSQIPIIIPGTGISIKRGFAGGQPMIQITNTGTGGGGTGNTTRCENCCYWA